MAVVWEEEEEEEGEGRIGGKSLVSTLQRLLNASHTSRYGHSAANIP